MPFVTQQTNTKRHLHWARLALLAGAFLLPVMALSGNEAVKKPEIAEEKPKPVDYKQGFAGSFLSGNFAKEHLDLDEASHYLEQTLQTSGGQSRFIFDSIRAHLLAGNINKAQKLAQSLPDKSQKEPMAALLLTVKKFQERQYDDALNITNATHERGLLAVIKPAIEGWLVLAKNTNKKSVISLEESITKSGFFAPFLHYQQALMYDLVGDSKNAQLHFEQAAKNPEMVPYRIATMLIKFYLREGERAKAENIIAAFNEHNDNPAFSISLDDDLFKRHDKEVALVSDGLAELFFTTASVLFGDDASIETLAYLRLALHLQPNFSAAQFLLAHVYEQQGSYKRALLIYDSIRPGNVFHERAQVRKALNLSALDRFEEANNILSKQARLHSEDISALVTMGDLLREKKRYAKAAELYSLAISRASEQSPAHWSLHYARGICYERTKQWPQAELDFLTALKQEPDQPDVLNYLSYSWLLMGKNIHEARENLQIAVAARPDDAHIIDSLGWAHYVAGDFDKSVIYLEKALNMTPYDAAINDHLGDAYWRVGRSLEARYQWRRALRQNPETQLKQTLKTKLERGLPPFLSKTAEGEKKNLHMKPEQAVSKAKQPSKKSPDSKTQ